MTDDRDLLPGEYAALGFLAQEPIHGYELARRWSVSPVVEVCPVEQSVIYGYLRNLEARALLNWEDVRVGKRPPRRIYELNEEGWSLLRSWMRTPVERMREVRLDLLLKLYFLGELDPVAVTRLFVAQIAVCERYIEVERAQLAEAEGFRRLIGEARVSAGEATLTWLSTHVPGHPGHEMPGDERIAS